MSRRDRIAARAAARQRQYRQRKGAGFRVVPVAVDFIEVSETLLETGRIDVADVDHVAAVGDAAARLMRDWARSVARNGVDPLKVVEDHETGEREEAPCLQREKRR